MRRRFLRANVVDCCQCRYPEARARLLRVGLERRHRYEVTGLTVRILAAGASGSCTQYDLRVTDLALSGRFPHAMMSDEDAYVVGRALTQAPRVVDEALSPTCQRMPNPQRVPRRQP